MEEKEKKTGEKKLIITFIVAILICFVMGTITGRWVKHHDLAGTLDMLMENGLQSALNIFIPVVYVGFNVICCVLAVSFYFRGKRIAEGWNGEDESIINRSEHKLSIALLVCNTALISNFFLYPAQMSLAFSKSSHINNDFMFALGCIVFALGYIYSFAVTKCVVDLEKRLNPEKKGNIFDFNFQRKWMESCDEGERLIVYQSAYRAYNVVNVLCMVLWVITVIAQLSFHTGLFPIAIVCIVWLASVTTYSISCVRFERNNE